MKTHAECKNTYLVSGRISYVIKAKC